LAKKLAFCFILFRFGINLITKPYLFVEALWTISRRNQLLTAMKMILKSGEQSGTSWWNIVYCLCVDALHKKLCNIIQQLKRFGENFFCDDFGSKT